MARKRLNPEIPPGKGRLIKSKPSISPSKLPKLPATYQELMDLLDEYSFKPFEFRREYYLQMEKITGRPVITYVMRTHNVPPGASAFVADDDLVGLMDLTSTINGDAVDVLIVSNGGSPEAAERIVVMLRERFDSVRFIVPHNAYSAATLICFGGDEILMGQAATLGPIDPQINGVPARAILRGVEDVERRMRTEGPEALAALWPLLEKYDLSLLEICKTAQELSKDLSHQFLEQYMLKGTAADKILKCVEYFTDYDAHKSHARSIHRKKAREQGLPIVNLEELEGMSDLVYGVYTQFMFWFENTPFYKMFENAYGTNWGRRVPATGSGPVMIQE